ncbi:MAG: hypothetical protein WB643_09220, partial [Candidatus Bathyarchaeia archaeon]
MTKLFLSLNFDHIKLGQQIKEELKRNGVEGVIAGEIAEAPPPEAIRSLILASDGLLAIITSEDYDWIQNEIGIAYAASLPVYAIVKEGIEPRGLLPRITTYIRISPIWSFDLKRKVAVIASELRKTSTMQVAIDRTEMLTGSSGILQLAIRPRKIPSGEEMITVYIPPEFTVSIAESNDLYDRFPEFVVAPVRKSTEIPKSACDIAASVAGPNEAYPRFRKIMMILRFPAAERYLNGGWAEFKLDYTSPPMAGKYRFFGSERISVAGGGPQDASSFEFEPIIVSGEVSPVYLSGIIFTSPQTPLKFPGVVSAVMKTRLDPYTGAERPDLPTVDAMCYLASSDEGRYMIPGVAPGTYDVFASAIGFSRFRIASGMKIHKQPESLDGYVQLTLSTGDNAALH